MPLRPETLKSYLEIAKIILVEVAKGKMRDRIITYQQLMDEMGGPGRGYIGEVLEEVCDNEYENGRPLLSAVVVHKTNRLPGNGFWKLRILPPSLKNASMEEKKNHWKQECRKVWEYWEKHDT